MTPRKLLCRLPSQNAGKPIISRQPSDGWKTGEKISIAFYSINQQMWCAQMPEWNQSKVVSRFESIHHYLPCNQIIIFSCSFRICYSSRIIFIYFNKKLWKWRERQRSVSVCVYNRQKRMYAIYTNELNRFTNRSPTLEHTSLTSAYSQKISISFTDVV